MSDVTLDELREALERNVRRHPHLVLLVSELEGSVRAFWEAEAEYVDRVRLLAGDEGVADVAKQGGPVMWHLAQDLGADHFMFNTKADLRAVLDAIARLPIAASECVEAGERVLTAWVPAERAVRALGLVG